MQKINKISKKGLVILSVLTGLNYYNVNAQVSCATIGNVSCGFGTEYLGWASTVGKTLDIKNEGNYPINFLTNTGAGGTTPVRMTITGSGNVGIGSTSPNYLLTQDGATGNASYHQFINGATTGTGTNDGFLVGIDGSGNGILNCRGGTPINFLTSGAKRMKIQGGGSLLIGDYSAATAYNQLVQYLGGNVNVYHGFVNGNTGVSNTSGNDGFKLGLTYNSGSSKSDAELISQQSGANMNFYTSNGSTTQRMTITSAGDVGIGTTSPAAKLNVAASTTGGSLTVGSFSLTNPGGSPTTTLGLSSSAVVLSATSNDGILASVNGGTTCRGFVASVNNTNTPLSTNIGYHAAVNCNAGSGGSSSINTGFNAEMQVVDALSANTGVAVAIGNSSSPIATYNYGGYFKTLNAQLNCGVYAEALSTTTNSSTATYYGVKSLAGWYSSSANAPYNTYGAFFEATGATNLNYGVYASGGSGGCTATSCTDAAGYFSGSVVTTAANYVSSDLFLKDNIQPITSANAILSQLNPVTYTFKSQQYPTMHLNESNNFGLISEEVELILPELVKSFAEPEVKDAQGNITNAQVDFKAVNYQALIPILIKAIQEQQLQIQALQAGAKTPSPVPTNQKEVKLSDKSIVVLEQNQPNPFKDNTTINFNIPEDVKQAQLLFYNSKGNVISTVEITEKGAGSLLVYGADLTSGVYTYTLLVDNRVVETKKMMKVK